MASLNVYKWLSFYTPFFDTKDRAREFIASVESEPIGSARHPAKILMHQVQRLVSLADDIPTIRRNNETLPLLFLIICAEHFAKTFDGFSEEGQSKRFVRNFFDWFPSALDTERLVNGILGHDRKPIGLQAAIDALYDVRCDLVHEGRYWGFHFHDGDAPMLMCDPDIIMALSMKDFRDIVVRSGIRGIQNYPKRPNAPLEHAR